MMETSAYGNQGLEGNAINGKQSINLQCLPSESKLDLAATEYTGNINIVLAYN